jgi:hypothetical protein
MRLKLPELLGIVYEEGWGGHTLRLVRRRGFARERRECVIIGNGSLLLVRRLPFNFLERL